MDFRHLMPLGALALVACSPLELGTGAFEGPDAAAVLTAYDGPFEVEVGFIANTRTGTIVPIDLKHNSLLSDQAASPFLRPRWVATGDERQLGQFVVWAPTDEQVSVLAADLNHNVLVEAPYIIGLSGDGEPQVFTPTHTEPVFLDVDGNGDDAKLQDLELRSGFTTTEDWTIEFDGTRWWAFGSRSGKQPGQALEGELYHTENKELVFTIEGDATEGDRFEFSTDVGLVEHDLGGPILGLERVPGTETALAAVWNVALEEGELVLWDLAAGVELGRIVLAPNAQPWRMSFSDDGATVYVADSALPAVYQVDLDTAVPSSSLVTEISTEAPVSALAWISDPGDASRDPYEHLMVAPVGANRVDIYDLVDETWIDINPLDDVFGGVDLRSPVVGLSPAPDPIFLQETANHGARVPMRVVGVTTVDGSFMMIEGDSGCLAIENQGPHVLIENGAEQIEWDDRGAGSNPALYIDGATGRGVIPSWCGGVAQSELWELTYDGTQGNWFVEGSLSGEQQGRAYEDQRYVSDTGAISFLILSGGAPTTDGDQLSFNMNDGILRIDELVLPSGQSTEPLELPAAPLLFHYDAGPTGGGWDEDRTQVHALVPITNSDLALRVRLQAWEVEMVWD